MTTALDSVNSKTGNTQRILVVDDESSISELISTSLRFVGFDVRTAANGAEALRVAEEFKPHAMVLDVMLPDLDGFEVCKKIRNEGVDTGVLFLTAKDGMEDKVKGLTLGGDDYMTKPFHTEEFTARVRALLRRNQDSTLTLECADLQLDLVKRQALRNGETIKLTTKEYALLEYLMRNQGRPLSRVQISQHVWDLHFDPESNIVDAYIKQLRKKIDHNGPKKLIKTIIGHGYTINEE